MSNNISNRKYLKRNNKKYRKFKMYYNLIFGFLIIFTIIYGLFHVFTKKTYYRNEGINNFNEGNYEAAIDNFNKALKCKQWFSDTVNVDIEMYKADSYIKLQDFSSANRVYTSILNKYPEKYYDKSEVDFLIELTEALDKYKYGDFLSTTDCFEKAVERGYIEISIYAANCYEKIDEFEKMKYYLDIYSTNYGLNSDICYKYTAYYLDINDLDNAIKYIEQGLVYNDNTYTQELKYSQILCYMYKEDYIKAFDLAGKYKEEYPDDTKGLDIYAYLDTRVNIDDEVINDIFEQNPKQENASETVVEE